MISRFIRYGKQYISNPLARNSVLFFASSMLVNVCAYLYHLFVGRILGPQKYGELAALLSFLFILNVPSLVLQTILTKYFSEFKANKHLGQSKSLFIAATGILSGLSIIGFIIFILCIPLLSMFLHIDQEEYFVLLFFIFASTFFTTISTSVLQGYQLFLSFTGISLFSQLLRLILGIVFSFFGVGFALFGNVISNILGYLIFFFPLRFIFSSKKEKLSITPRKALGYSIPTFLATLGITLLYSQDVMLVKHFFPSIEAGLYASLAVLGKIIFFASSSIGFVFFPVIVEKTTLKQKYNHLILAALSAVAAISLPLTIVYFLFPQFVITILFGKAYISAAGLLGWFGIFISFYALSNLLVTLCLAANKTHVWILTISAGVIQIIGMSLFHQSLWQVIILNSSITILLFIVLLLYYKYGK